ncbi:unnamed protein product [Acanthoscelides obtectus]|uniref:Transcription initiation factor TFIID subunit 12 n=2 Tax=Acanthoscelides obtectus TaxID=200917 RepID=A0A9P0KCT0_ACAOB|nr:unnamed protein product [Acanthoscelides obtectus]CAK1669333.1 Transcription initiation factor TFIID subunit 12 [Acanthoscelides obtectus]
MSVQNIPGNIMQQQNIVLNQVPMSHAILTNVNASNGLPVMTHTTSAEQNTELKTAGIPMETVGASNMAAVQNVSVTNTTHMKSVAPQNTSSSEPIQVLTKQRLHDLVRETDQTLNLEEEVEEIILSYVDEFVDRVLNGASMIAKNRHANTIEVKDVQQFLNRNYNMWVPGFGTDELKPYKRSLTTEAHKQRLALIRKTLKKY